MRASHSIGLGIRWVRLLTIVLVPLIGIPAVAKTPDNDLRERRRQWSIECEKLLQTSVIDFYLPCVDRNRGGYFENLGPDNHFREGGGKFLTLQARQLWTFSTLAAKGIRATECLAAARHGYAFIQEKHGDAQFGGYYNQLHDDGSIHDERKHAYLNSFVIYALVAYHHATGEQQPLDKAMELFHLLEAKAYDSVHGGYHEFFHRDWSLVTDPKVPGIVGAVGVKTYNTHLHLMESFAELYRATKDPLVGKRLAELISINTVTVRHPRHGCNIDAWYPNWTVVDTSENLRASYGHDVECAWLVLDAVAALGWSKSPQLGWAKELVETSVRHGWDDVHGGFCYTGELGAPATDRHKEWWVQVEAMVCFLELFQLTGNEVYLSKFEKTFEFIRKHQIAEEGGWWASRQADGTPSANRSRTSMWQGGYHTGRALLRCAELLRE